MEAGRSESTKIVAVLDRPAQFLSRRTVACGVLMMVQVNVAPSTAGEVTGNGPPV